MGMEVTVREPLWDCLPGTITWLRSQRDTLACGDQAELRAGLNFAIILSTACYLEGGLEAALVGLLHQRRNAYAGVVGASTQSNACASAFFNRLADEVDSRIVRTAGSENYDEMFDLLVGKRLSALPQVAGCWEGIKVLFHIRNVIGHGRPTAARFLWQGGNSWEEEFRGGYRIAQDYLLKRRLIDSRFVVVTEQAFQATPRLLFTDAVADHFWHVARSCVEGLVADLEGEDKEAVAAILHIQ